MLEEATVDCISKKQDRPPHFVGPPGGRIAPYGRGRINCLFFILPAQPILFFLF